MFKFYNPFARIRNLQREVARQYSRIVSEERRNANIEASRNAWRDLYFRETDQQAAEIGRLNQAIDAHMDERGETASLFLQGAEVLERAAIRITHLEQTASYVGQLLDEAIRQLEVSRKETADQAGEIVEIVTWIKQAEQALAGCGVSIADTEEGPRVTVDTEGMRNAVQTNRVSLVMPNDVAQAA